MSPATRKPLLSGSANNSHNGKKTSPKTNKFSPGMYEEDPGQASIHMSPVPPRYASPDKITTVHPQSNLKVRQGPSLKDLYSAPGQRTSPAPLRANQKSSRVSTVLAQNTNSSPVKTNSFIKNQKSIRKSDPTEEELLDIKQTKKGLMLRPRKYWTPRELEIFGGSLKTQVKSVPNH